MFRKKRLARLLDLEWKGSVKPRGVHANENHTHEAPLPEPTAQLVMEAPSPDAEARPGLG